MDGLASSDAPWDRLDHALATSALSKISTALECSICSDIMIIPVTSECGHTYCYGCINQWFKNKVNCPTCRHRVEMKPALNLKLNEICKTIIDLSVENTTDPANSLAARTAEYISEYTKHAQTKKLYGGIFENTTSTLIDTSDGVPRCGHCHWEAHGSVCLHCGRRFRIPQDSDGEGEDEDEYYEDVRTSRGVEASSDAYDSDDSFIDTRTAEEILRESDRRHRTSGRGRGRGSGSGSGSGSGTGNNRNAGGGGVGDSSFEVDVDSGDDEEMARIDVLSSDEDAARARFSPAEDWSGFESASSSNSHLVRDYVRSHAVRLSEDEDDDEQDEGNPRQPARDTGLIARLRMRMSSDNEDDLDEVDEVDDEDDDDADDDDDDEDADGDGDDDEDDVSIHLPAYDDQSAGYDSESLSDALAEFHDGRNVDLQEASHDETYDDSEGEMHYYDSDWGPRRARSDSASFVAPEYHPRGNHGGASDYEEGLDEQSFYESENEAW
ncbi:uncharacterized protein LODBEIA_P23560 [Lodderomyces beijingensis]|uniref:RING-type domain-containing protein n=1 Tax=Lodderomyces beijingensis TaxID=1775926 RepID=A0ABP0ZPM7_9ASCO